MYADRITDSIKNAMTETERRRRKQIQYNKKNQITPKSVIKPIPEKTEDIDLFVDTTKSMARADLVKLAIETETTMRRFAEDLDFERAIKFREKLIKIKRSIGEEPTCQRYHKSMHDKIIIKGAREHNLKNINLEIPKNKLVVITGLSGSGKSTLAFDTIYAEGQRRYVESLSAYARQFLELMDKPDVDSIDGLSPAISIQQKTTSKNPRSTVRYCYRDL